MKPAEEFIDINSPTNEPSPAGGQARTNASNNDVASKLRQKLLTPEARRQRAQAAIDIDPTHIGAWLELVRCLPLVTLGAADPGSSQKDRQVQRHSDNSAAVEIQLSVFEKALELHPSNRRSTRLLFERLRILASSDVWGPSEVDAEFRRVLRQCQNMPTAIGENDAAMVDVWLLYLSWLEGSWSLFRFEDLLGEYKEAFNSLRNRMFASSSTLEDFKTSSNSLATGLVSLFTRLLATLLHSGYHEMAAALVQVNLNLSLDLHADITKGLERAWNPQLDIDTRQQRYRQLVEVLRSAWVSGQISESTSAFSATRSQPPSTGQSRLSTLEEDTGTVHSFASRWLAAEMARCEHRVEPARLHDVPEWEVEGDEIDPYATVLFSDLEAFLVPLPKGHAQQQLVEICVGFNNDTRTGLSDLAADINAILYAEQQPEFASHPGLKDVISAFSSWQRPQLLPLDLESNVYNKERGTPALPLLMDGAGTRSRIDELLSAQALDHTLSLDEERKLWYFRIQLELHSDHPDESEVRKLFVQATNSDAGRHDIRLWELYVQYEARSLAALSSPQDQLQGGTKAKKSISAKHWERQTARARAVCFDAIKACPSSKSIYLRGFVAPLSHILTAEELKGIFDTMVEKQIRVQVDLADFMTEEPTTTAQGGSVADAEEASELSDEPIDDPFDPNLPYVKRDPRYEQVGGGPSPAAPTSSATHVTDSRTIDLLKLQAKAVGSVGVQHLPVEVLHRILVLSGSSSFPVTCRYFRSACQHASVTDKVDYILGRWMARYMDYIIVPPCRHKHKECKRKASYLATLWSNHEPSLPDFAKALAQAPCDLAAARDAHLDVVSFAAEFGICNNATVLARVISEAAGSRLPAVFLASPLRTPSRPVQSFKDALVAAATSPNQPCEGRLPTGAPQPQLPKRLFRRIEQFGLMDIVTDTQVGGVANGDRPRKKRKRRHGSSDATAVNSEMSSSAGPLPGQEELQLVLVMLSQYGADASSHQGYPLAMAVHRRSYPLVHLLLLFGADPACKDGLAVQIAIRNGALDILRLLVTGPCFDADAAGSLPLPSQSGPMDTVSLQFADHAQLRLGSRPFQLDQSHLRLAIQSRQWELVDYIWHERQVSPDIACLRLIEKLRQ